VSAGGSNRGRVSQTSAAVAEAATSTLLGTPFGPLVSALPADAQHQPRARLAGKLGDSAGGVIVRTVSNVGRGTK
jgi:hypothetical protein